MTLRHCSAVTSTESPLISMPAAVTSTRGTPSRLWTTLNASATAAWSVTSTRWA